MSGTDSNSVPASDSETTAVVSASNAFGFDLYHHLRAGKDNIFLSPYSILNVLSVAAEGARGSTAEEMRRALHFPPRAASIHAGLAALARRFTFRGDTRELHEIKSEIERLRVEQEAVWKRGETACDWEAMQKVARESGAISRRIHSLMTAYDPTELSVANVLWGEKTYPFSQSYLDRIATYYGAGALQQADFRGRAEAERARINTWCAERTRGRIPDLLPQGSLDELTRLVLTNAIYFKGDWSSPFDAGKTQRESFTLASGDKLKVDLMKQDSMRVRYGAFEQDGAFFDTPTHIVIGAATQVYPAADGFAIVELPYQGGKLSMVVIAPTRASGLQVIEQMLDAKTLSSWIGRLQPREVHVYVPRFKWETDYVLNELLAAIGMPSAFKNPMVTGGADFGGMTDSSRPEEQLFIRLVRHKAFVEVNEKGTEASAATAACMEATAALQPVTKPFIPTFQADRPCIYVIRDVETGCILFLGRMTRPA